MNYEDAPEHVRLAVDDLQADIRAVVEMMADTFAVIDGEPMTWPHESTGQIAFDAGVEAGSAAAMAVLHRRGWLTFPPESSPQ